MNDINKQGRKSGISKSILNIAIIIILIGLFAVFFPVAMGKITVVLLGILFILGGGLRLSFAIFSSSTGSKLLRYIFSILMILIGIWLIATPDVGLKILTVALAVYFIADGISSIVYSFSVMPRAAGTYLLLNGIISLLLGILIWANWPHAGNYFLGIYVGIKLLFDGLALYMTSKALKKN